MTWKVYLVGIINANPESHKWRFRVEKALGAKFQVMNPVRSQYDKELAKEFSGSEQENYEAAINPERAGALLAPKSYASSITSDVIIFNSQYVAERPMVGSISELAWAWEHNKPIVGICPDAENNLYVKHPFIKVFVTHWVKTEEEAVEVVKNHFP